MIDSFVLLAYESSEASRNFLQRILAGVNLALDIKYLFCSYQRKGMFLSYGNNTDNRKPWK